MNKIVTLPLEAAVQLAMKENIERDVLLEVTEEPLSDEERKIYEKEARHLLTTTGENYAPDFPQHHLIRVGKEELTEEDRKHSEFP